MEDHAGKISWESFEMGYEKKLPRLTYEENVGFGWKILSSMTRGEVFKFWKTKKAKPFSRLLKKEPGYYDWICAAISADTKPKS